LKYWSKNIEIALFFGLERHFYHKKGAVKKDGMKCQERIGITFPGLFGTLPIAAIRRNFC